MAIINISVVDAVYIDAEIVFADAGLPSIANHDYMRMTLRRTLLPRDQQLLDEVWEGQINQNCYRNIIRAFLPTQIRRTLNRMMYNWGLPMEIAREIGRIASVDAIDWWRVESPSTAASDTYSDL
ncbi:hypothetical protein OIU85_004777 [Salix viminalis]|uniref:Uncharacterized protein n=1 Tax=Salix viminalis TaxID=40686 RepID=A0A9Q0PU04_SALVM|nr:hypothetical protein OIU85_004777 [Salix viminalis]